MCMMASMKGWTKAFKEREGRKPTKDEFAEAQKRIQEAKV